MIEGSSYYYDPDTHRIAKRDVLESDGSVKVRKQAEPYVTVDPDGKLLLKVPSMTSRKEQRQALGKMKIPSLEKVKGSQATLWRFEPKDFATMRGVVGGMAMSHQASQILREYFEELTRAENAANAKNLARYSSERLGLRLPLRVHVKKALAWLDANGNKGICALDTGMGKTVTAIAAMQNLRAKGEVGKDNNGRFLYVAETALLGNLPKEIYKFIDKDQADSLLDITDVLNYARFNKARRGNPTFGDDYVAIFFDEAHLRMKKRTQSSYKAAVNCQCKHKILMTASPMVKSPKEVLTLASVANSDDLNTREGLKQSRDFSTRFAESVGGRIVGITQQEDDARAFRVWVKRNLYFADKREVAEEEAQLAITGRGKTNRDLRKETVAVTMPPGIEGAYRKAMKDVLKILRPLIKERYDRKDPRSLSLAAEAVSRRLTRPLKLLTQLSDTPNLVIPGAPNPKLDRAKNIIQQDLAGRTLMFTDNATLAKETFERMRRDFPGKGHVVGYSGMIIYADPAGQETKYRKRQYVDPETGRKIKADEWKTFVLNKILGLGMKEKVPVYTAVLTGSYAVGQNLQSFGTVIQLDRDDWSSETMKQRTARAWRAGNKKPVDEYTLDMVYPDTSRDDDASQTLDELRRVIQEIDADLFDRVVLDSQVEKLGEEWLSIKKQRSALHKIDRQMLERALSPYATDGAQEDEV
jgi:SNF2 family DNA or RNA helicase